MDIRLASLVRLVVLAIVFSLLCVPAIAQYGYYAHWQITYTWTGSESGSGATPYSLIPESVSHTESSPPGGATQVPTLGDAASSWTSLVSPTIQGQVTITTTLTWVGYGQPPPPSSQPVYLLESPHAYITGGPSQNLTGSADDGFGDSSINGSSAGNHLTQHDGSSGTITLSRTLTANASSSAGNQLGLGNGSSGAGVMFNYYVVVDSRGVIITSVLDQVANYYAVQPWNSPLGGKEPNVRNSDGSMKVDTIPGPPMSGPAGSGIPSSMVILFQCDWLLNPTWTAVTTGFDLTKTYDLFGNVTGLKNTQIEWSIQADPATYVASVNLLDPTNIENSGWVAGYLGQLSTSVKAHVKVTDLRPGQNAVAENDYTILIHEAVENAEEIPSRVFDHYDPYPWSSPPVNAGAATQVQMVQDEPASWGLDGATPQQVAGSSMQGLAGSGLVALMMGPEGGFYEAIFGDMLFNAVGWHVSQTGTPDPTSYVTEIASFSNFTFDVK